MCGGIEKQDKPADAEVQGLVDKVKSAITSKMNANFEVFEAVSYRTQVVAGVNYFIKVYRMKSKKHFHGCLIVLYHLDRYMLVTEIISM